MSYDKISRYQTDVIESDGSGMVKYRNTVIVEWNAETITLRSGGWETVTTKRKMNQAANEFCLGFSVYQKNDDWFATLPNGETVTFDDGMTFERN